MSRCAELTREPPLSGGHPFSPNSAVGSMVAGSIVIKHEPSDGTMPSNAEITARQ